MRLTKKKAIEISIELWTWIAEEDGRAKWDWPGWEKYGHLEAHCPFCEYNARHEKNGCVSCIYHQRFGHCYDSPYFEWDCTGKAIHAQAFLEQLKQL